MTILTDKFFALEFSQKMTPFSKISKCFKYLLYNFTLLILLSITNFLERFLNNLFLKLARIRKNLRFMAVGRI